ncbi:hypothetical protein KVQ82_01565 [Pseudomonas sp. AO-1]|uniref:hypothetical protein n=1 Tax=Pseudomonas sp. AO-1 TaxID=2855434 RepID=UPI001C73EBB4|nr:hypothetical protein [Pseudomonas sp. AO-1]QXZ14643.1 hypothetical protein KVQ82_01565 [Pseudomonas sp. AO-1]
MKVYVTSLTLGSVVGCLCTSSMPGLVGLFLASIVMSFLISRLIPHRSTRFEALTCYCLGVLAFSQKMSQLLSMTSKGEYASVFWELPELIIGVLLVPLMGIIAVHLINLLMEDRIY